MDRLERFLEAHGVVLGDGAIGTMLQAAGLTTGGAPEEWNVARPDVVAGVHRAYAAAGAQILTTNSFGGTRFRLGREGLAGRVGELNAAAARLAREAADAADREILVAGSVGPTGEILAPLGLVTAEEAQAAFAEQAAALAEGGVDFFLVETMSALEEVAAAVSGIRSASALPVAVTMTFDTRFHTMMGVSPQDAVRALHEQGVRVMGANCGNGPAEIERVIAEMAEVRPAGVHLVAQSNAGLPRYVDRQIRYDGTPAVMAAYALRMRELGVGYVGACCGSTPEHIAAMRAALEAGS